MSELIKQESSSEGVGSTEYWLMKASEHLGTLQLRHELHGRFLKFQSQIRYEIAESERGKGYGNLILKLGLEQAKLLGFQTLTITCLETNLASQKIIEKNGGKFIEKATVQGDHEPITILKYELVS